MPARPLLVVLACALAALGFAPAARASTAVLLSGATVNQDALDSIILLPNGRILSAADAALAALDASDTDVLVRGGTTGISTRYDDAALFPLDTLAHIFAQELLVYHPDTGLFGPYSAEQQTLTDLLNTPGVLVVLDGSAGAVAAGAVLLGSEPVSDDCPDDPTKDSPGACGCGVPDDDQDGDGVLACRDCDDQAPAVHPGAAEVCNGIDDDCNGLVDADDPAMPPCDDGNACTTVDLCRDGRCVGTSPVVCAAPAPCHDPGTCDPQTGLCTDALQADGARCEDGDSCTVVDQCLEGNCLGDVPLDCPAPAPCHSAGVCDPETGGCVYAPRSDGTPCDDGNACTRAEACQAGACVAQLTVDCDDGNACTDDTCVPERGCVHEGRPGCCRSDHDCTDTSACTVNERCEAGRCTSDAVVCADPAPCVRGTCDPGSGCTSVLVPDGAPCGGGDPCAGAAECAAGACVARPLGNVDETRCRLGELTAATACGAEQLDARLLAALQTHVGRAQSLLAQAAGGAVRPARMRALVRQADRQLRPLQRSIRQALHRHGISVACAQQLGNLLTRRRQLVVGLLHG